MLIYVRYRHFFMSLSFYFNDGVKSASVINTNIRMIYAEQETDRESDGEATKGKLDPL